MSVWRGKVLDGNMESFEMGSALLAWENSYLVLSNTWCALGMVSFGVIHGKFDVLLSC